MWSLIDPDYVPGLPDQWGDEVDAAYPHPTFGQTRELIRTAWELPQRALIDLAPARTSCWIPAWTDPAPHALPALLTTSIRPKRLWPFSRGTARRGCPVTAAGAWLHVGSRPAPGGLVIGIAASA